MVSRNVLNVQACRGQPEDFPLTGYSIWTLSGKKNILNRKYWKTQFHLFLHKCLGQNTWLDPTRSFCTVSLYKFSSSIFLHILCRENGVSQSEGFLYVPLELYTPFQPFYQDTVHRQQSSIQTGATSFTVQQINTWCGAGTISLLSKRTISFIHTTQSKVSR